MACEVQKLATAVALGNAIASTPGAAFGAAVPPLEPLLAFKMWLSWMGLLVSLGFLADCLEQNGRGEDAGRLREEQQRLRQELDALKQRVQ